MLKKKALRTLEEDKDKQIDIKTYNIKYVFLIDFIYFHKKSGAYASLYFSAKVSFTELL